jgi:hypothetical protein
VVPDELRTVGSTTEGALTNDPYVNRTRLLVDDVRLER